MSQSVQGLHGMAEEALGQALSPVLRVGEKFGDESRFGSIVSEGPVCGDDGGSDAPLCVGRQQGGLRDRSSVRAFEDGADLPVLLWEYACRYRSVSAGRSTASMGRGSRRAGSRSCGPTIAAREIRGAMAACLSPGWEKFPAHSFGHSGVPGKTNALAGQRTSR